MLLEKFKKDFERREITKQEGSFSLLIYGSVFPIAFPPYINRYYDFDFKSFLFFAKEDRGTIFFDLEKYFETTTVTFYRFFKIGDKEKLPEYKEFKIISRNINKLYQSYPPDKIAGMRNNDLEELINKGFELSASILTATVFCESLDEKIVNKFYKETKAEEKEFYNFFNCASKTGFKSFAARFDEALLSLKDSNNFYQSQWILSNYYICPDLSESEVIIKKFIDEKGGFKKIKEELTKMSKMVAINKKELESYRDAISESEKKIFDYIQLCIYVRDVRKEPLLKLIAFISNIAREIFKRNRIVEDDIVYGFYDDFINGFYKKDNYTEEIKKRKKGVTVYFNKKGYEFEYGNVDEVKKKIYFLMDNIKISEAQELKGSIGNKGKVRAPASIILNKSEFQKFVPGNVLVTSMTRAEFVPLMKIASAIVTDEGGITCHAAIVAREMKKPCIIGTKNATRILHDGDIVEVDADKGVVRILERAK